MPVARLKPLYHKVANKFSSSKKVTNGQTEQPAPASIFHPLPGMEDVLKSITNGLLVCDIDKRILLTNPALETITGLSSKDITIQGFFDSIGCTGVDLDKKLTEGLQKGETIHIDDICIGKSIYEMFINPVRSFNGQISGAAIVVHDVTAIKEIDRVKTEFLSVAAHQLRTPLGSMRWNIELLLSGDIGKISPEVKQTLMQVYQGTQRMIILVGELLSVSRIEQSRVFDQPSSVDVIGVIKDVTKEIEFSSLEKSVKVELLLGKEKIPKVSVDSQRFRDVIQNLLSNAVKYNQQGKNVEVKVEYKEKTVNITVADHGIGIPKKDQGQIFSKFFRADNAIKSQTEGNGLGLFIVKSYVESWGGKVWFESEEGKGTVFYMKIPERPINHILDKNLVRTKVKKI